MLQVRYRYRLLPERRFEYVDDSVVELTGYTADELYADPDAGRRILHPMDHPALKEFLESHGGGRMPAVLHCVKKDGAMITIEHRVTLVRDGLNQVVAMEGVAELVPDPHIGGELAAERGLSGAERDLPGGDS